MEFCYKIWEPKLVIGSFSGSSRAWIRVLNQVFNKIGSRARVQDWKP